jgi:hypothetical protein
VGIVPDELNLLCGCGVSNAQSDGAPQSVKHGITSAAKRPMFRWVRSSEWMLECYGSRVDDYETINAVQLEPGENAAVKAAALP